MKHLDNEIEGIARPMKFDSTRIAVDPKIPAEESVLWKVRLDAGSPED